MLMIKVVSCSGLLNQGTLLGFVADDQEHVIMDTLLTMFPCDDVDKVSFGMPTPTFS